MLIFGAVINREATAAEKKQEAKTAAAKDKIQINISLPRHAYVRGQKIRGKVNLACNSPKPFKDKAKISLLYHGKPVAHADVAFSADNSPIPVASFQFDTKPLKVGKYLLSVSVAGFPTKKENIWIASPLDKRTIGFGFYGYQITGHGGWKIENYPAFTRKNVDKGLDLLSSANMNAFAMIPISSGSKLFSPDKRDIYCYYLDQSLVRGIGWIPLMNGYYFKRPAKSPDDIAINSEGKPQVAMHTTKKHPHLSFISPSAHNLLDRLLVPKWIMAFKDHPGYSGKIYFGDDVFMMRGSGKSDFRNGPLFDYSPVALRAFKKKTALNAPRKTAEELEKVNGVLPDNDPWLQWMRFRCEDMFANYQAHIISIINEKLPGSVAGSQHGRVWSPSNAFVPASEHKVLTLTTYYNYPASPYRHIFDVELVRMGCGDKEIWVTVSGHNSVWNKWMRTEVMAEYERACFNSVLAAGGKGITYCPFHTQSQFTEHQPVIWREWQRQGRTLKRYGRLLHSLSRTDQPVGLLISFATDSYRSLMPAEKGFTGPFFKSHYFRVMGTFMAMLRAQIPVEMIDEETIASGRYSHLRVIYLADVQVLPKSVAKGLEKFISAGGTVLMDNLCRIKIKGAKKLQSNTCLLPFDSRNRPHYSNPRIAVPTKEKLTQVIHQLQKDFKGLVEPAVKTDSLELAVREFSGEGIRYLYLVNLNHDKPLQVKVDFGKAGTPIDVFASQPIKDGRINLSPAGGTLVAIPQQLVKTVSIEVPLQVVQIKTVSIGCRFRTASGEPFKGLLPVSVTFINPAGETDKEWSGYYTARAGKLMLSPIFGVNNRPGRWTVIVKELLTEKASKHSFVLTPAG